MLTTGSINCHNKTMTLPTMKKFPWARLIKFAIVGGIAFAIDFAIYLLLTRMLHVPYLLSRCFSIGAAMAWNFSLNRTWTFQAQSGKMSRQAARFTVVMVITSGLNLGLMRLGVSTLHLNDLLVLVAVSLLIMLVNFCAHHFWSYR